MNPDTVPLLYFIPNVFIALYGVFQAARGLRDVYPPLHKMHVAVLALCVGYLILKTRAFVNGWVPASTDGYQWMALEAAAIWTLARFSRELRINASRVRTGVEVEQASGARPRSALIGEVSGGRGVSATVRRAAQSLVDNHL